MKAATLSLHVPFNCFIQSIGITEMQGLWAIRFIIAAPFHRGGLAKSRLGDIFRIYGRRIQKPTGLVYRNNREVGLTSHSVSNRGAFTQGRIGLVSFSVDGAISGLKDNRIRIRIGQVYRNNRDVGIMSHWCLHRRAITQGRIDLFSFWGSWWPRGHIYLLY